MTNSDIHLDKIKSFGVNSLLTYPLNLNFQKIKDSFPDIKLKTDIDKVSLIDDYFRIPANDENIIAEIINKTNYHE